MSFGPDGAGEPAGTGRDVLEIVAEQAALRRVATLVARGVSHEELFAVVNQELARLVGADAAALLHEQAARARSARADHSVEGDGRWMVR